MASYQYYQLIWNWRLIDSNFIISRLICMYRLLNIQTLFPCLYYLCFQVCCYSIRSMLFLFLFFQLITHWAQPMYHSRAQPVHHSIHVSFKSILALPNQIKYIRTKSLSWSCKAFIVWIISFPQHFYTVPLLNNQEIMEAVRGREW